MQAAARAAYRTVIVIVSAGTRSLPIVRATATPNKNGPAKLPRAAIISAARADIAREEMIVATTAALSWTPFKKS